jgi:hypothetical protein
MREEVLSSLTYDLRFKGRESRGREDRESRWKMEKKKEKRAGWS